MFAPRVCIVENRSETGPVAGLANLETKNVNTANINYGYPNKTVVANRQNYATMLHVSYTKDLDIDRHKTLSQKLIAKTGKVIKIQNEHKLQNDLKQVKSVKALKTVNTIKTFNDENNQSSKNAENLSNGRKSQNDQTVK